jgi:predicted lipoprotein with Yx(FWY)xxD motif
MKRFFGLVALGAMIVVLSACGADGQASPYQPAANKSAHGGGPTAGPTAGPTVSQKAIPGVGTVLVSRTGMTLYSPQQEADGRISCTAACTRFWQPLLSSKGAKSPTKGPGVSGKLAVVERPDGSRQVAFDGKPLYTFVEDGGPGEAKGEGFGDSFGGRRFSWQVVRVGEGPSARGGGGSQNHGGYGGGY